ncbi:MAG: CbiX/SirB N-terminal domain-containing protein [Chthoniobacterales bacterium]
MSTELHEAPPLPQSKINDPRSKLHSALVLIGHGSTLNPDSSAPTHDHAATIRARGIFGEVVSTFWKEEPSFREVLRMIEADDIYLVPNFISEGYFTQTVIPRELELDGPVTRVGSRTLKYCEPVGSHPAMTDVILQRARETAPSVDPAAASLLIVGHGTGLNDNSAKAAKDQVRWISDLGIYGEVLATYMEEPPLISEWDTITKHPDVVVVPFFIADGLHSYQDIPVLLGTEEEGAPAASQRDVFRKNPHSLRGKRVHYASAIGTEPSMVDVILEQVSAFDAAHPE